MKMIYLDNAATTKVDERVLKAMQPYFTEKYINASSKHIFGNQASDAVEKSRAIIAKSIKATPYEIIFTSGGTESNNLALKGLFFANSKKHIITTKIEHDCILNTCKWLEKQGAKITYLDVDKNGFVNPDELEKAITPDTLCFSCIHGNNEIGTIQNLEVLGNICKKHNIYFHTDACQSYTKTKLNVKKQNLDLVTLNAHKIHGPKGVGALYVKAGIKLTPLLHGGGHEKGLRSGTENVPGIVGFATAVKLANKKHIKHMQTLRDKIISNLLEIPGVKLNGSRQARLCNNINVSFNNIEGESIGGDLEDKGIYTSTGSACLSHSLQSSHVLKAIGLTGLEANSSLRITLSRFTTQQEVDTFLKEIKGVVKRLRKISPIKLNGK
ncbi:MAG: cysteine desulfurase family protein [Candidatus Nanoarchaeia archaeon]